MNNITKQCCINEKLLRCHATQKPQTLINHFYVQQMFVLI